MSIFLQIHTRKIDKWTYEARNLTKYEGRDACGGDDWNVDDHVPTGPQLKNNRNEWPREAMWLTVEPYTYYALFVSTLIMREAMGKFESYGFCLHFRIFNVCF
jgi:hypothetical protein